MSDVTREQRSQNRPIYSIAAAVLLVAILVLALIFTPVESMARLDRIISTVLLAIPILIGAGFAERTARDVRNGVVQDKVREGTHQALAESGVRDVVESTQRGATAVASLQALTALTASDQDTRDALARLLSTPRQPAPGLTQPEVDAIVSEYQGKAGPPPGS